ncbi:tripartite tricarboxylate transporter permease [Paracoccus caeni]|uniref:Tripartite tricarboxylate transporter permease n=1 Tax=Paracoccus caeni TaxID=657651 RepID=A0A934SHT6_9RHOB|nr:tripartite tricarboxylate transporter permease [Paracoccus caeni]MBK4217913.1 tripartite tricarboxylate transporter permease [Paracoccus caeni]
MDQIIHLFGGFSTIFTGYYLMMCLAGVLMGQVIGALPGIGPSAAIALLLPLTLGADPTGALIMFAGLYAGSQYGGTLTAVLLNVPGEASSVMTAVDGHQLALQGRAGPALGTAAIASFIAGTVGTVGLMFLAPPLASIALNFGPPEYFGLILVGLTTLAAVGGSLSKGIAAGLLGLIIALIGIDGQSGVTRFTFGQLWLLDGIEFTVIAVAVFGVGEVLATCYQTKEHTAIEVKNAYPTRDDLRQSAAPIARGTGLGFLIGVLPAAGATLASFMAYILEKKVAKQPERFGHGAIEGVAGPEAANNSAVSGALVPMFALGIPGSGTTALMLGALIMFGLRPGPDMFTTNGDLIWGVIASMFVANVLLLILNIPLAGMFARLLTIRYSWIYPPILGICLLGAFANSNSLQDCWLLVAFGVLGWMMKRYEWPQAPLVLGLVLGPIFETTMRQSMSMSRGDPLIFLQRPISLTLILIALAAIALPIISYLRRNRPTVSG